VNSGTSTLTADSCAGCHRAHTAQGSYLLAAAGEEALCLSCHDGTGATTNVELGVQYVPTGLVGEGTDLGALRNGGFLEARIGDPMRIAYPGLRGKVQVGASEPVTSSHLHVPGSPVTTMGIAWGNGANGSGAGPEVELGCTSCHNPHGNGQYRILNPLPSLTATNGAFSDPTPINVAFVNGTTGQEYIETAAGHVFMAGDLVTVTGVTGVTNGDYVVVNVPNGIRIKINAVAAWPTTTALDLPGTGPTASTGTISRTKAPVADSPLGTPDGNGKYPTKNYTVIQTKGTQGDNSTYLLYAADVITAGFGPTEGDYFRRTVPWNLTSGTTDEAPNGKPATITAAAPALGSGDVAFNVQMTSWCTTCHTRYFGYQNPNPTGTEPGTSTQAVKNITDITGNVITLAAHGYAVGDLLHITGVTTSGDVSADGDYRVADVLTADTFWVTGSNFNNDTAATAQRIAPVTASAYFYPRVGDDIFKYQHSTRANRVCTTCHVTHGSNVVMTGEFSSGVAYPDGTVSDSSRLLKVSNRGTCTLCHDPTETVLGGTYSGPNQGVGTIASSDAATDVFTLTGELAGLSVGDFVAITGHSGLPTSVNGGFYIKSMPSTTTFTVSATSATGATFNVTTGGTGGTVTIINLIP
jgi:predicted CXXCH cytochrome family protein